ncbi:MAG TPA: hypothetical protein VF048_09535 [Gemmatimonadaceae bacterium]
MRSLPLSTIVLLAGLAGPAHAQAAHGAADPSADGPASDRALIANALSAAPASVAATATVMGHDGRVLRQGSGDWVCMPDMPDVPNDTPMCLDAPWRSFIDAWMHRRTPTVTQVGFGYMLQGDLPVSNTDPFATAPTATNQWIQHGGPHVMVLIPDQRLLDGLPTDPTSGGPFVMWKGTPYAHVMIPAPTPPR